MNGFQKIINKIDGDRKVLDVGGWGRKNGVNTTRVLIDGFGKNVTTLNNKAIEGVDIITDWFSYTPEEKLDVIVVDMVWKMNWNKKEFERTSGFLKKDGILITYINLESIINPLFYNKINLRFEKVDYDGYKKWFDLIDIYPENGIEEGRRGVLWVSFQKK